MERTWVGLVRKRQILFDSLMISQSISFRQRLQSNSLFDLLPICKEMLNVLVTVHSWTYLLKTRFSAITTTNQKTSPSFNSLTSQRLKPMHTFTPYCHHKQSSRYILRGYIRESRHVNTSIHIYTYSSHTHAHNVCLTRGSTT